MVDDAAQGQALVGPTGVGGGWREQSFDRIQDRVRSLGRNDRRIAAGPVIDQPGRGQGALERADAWLERRSRRVPPGRAPAGWANRPTASPGVMCRTSPRRSAQMMVPGRPSPVETRANRALKMSSRVVMAAPDVWGHAVRAPTAAALSSKTIWFSMSARLERRYDRCGIVEPG